MQVINYYLFTNITVSDTSSYTRTNTESKTRDIS